ncbi:MAG: hypothetical protein ABIA93_02600 [Candidatus Woesearchaeota archaeon]
MTLNEESRKKLLEFVRPEPRTMQDVANVLGVSWHTAESYVSTLGKQTGLVDVKVFRPGTKAALKIVYWNYSERNSPDEVREGLVNQLMLGRKKGDFDVLDMFELVPDERKRAVTEPPKVKTARIRNFIEATKSELSSFSGNISWMRLPDVAEALEKALKRGVHVTILSRIDYGTIENYRALNELMKRYPGSIEIRHAFQPLRGFIRDGELVQLKDEKEYGEYRSGEMRADSIRIVYEITDKEWVDWIQHVFWTMFRRASQAESRIRELNRLQTV